jgi:rRNA-processing protein FCF1
MITSFDRVVIDSGPLFTILTLNYFIQTNRRSLLQTIDEDIRRSVSMQNACLELFRSIRFILTTSHVIGEIQGLQTSRLGLKGKDFQGFWLGSMELLALNNFDERLLRLIEDGFRQVGVRQTISKIGPTDGGLIELALREGCVLLTDDQRTLAPLAYRLGVDCRIFKPMLG